MCVAVWEREIDRRRSVSTRDWARDARRDLAGEHLRLVHDQPGDRRLHVADLDPGAVLQLDDALVGELAAALGVERGAVEHELDLVALAGGLDDAAGRDDAADRALADDLAVAGELDRAADRVGDLAVGARVDVLALLGLRVGLRAVPLLGHQPAEALLVDGEPLLGRHLEGQVDREAVGVVQRERPGAGELRAAALLHLGRGQVEDRGAGLEGLPEGLLLGVGDGGDPLPVLVQRAVGLAHLVAADRHQLGQRAVLVAEQAHRADRTAQQPPQDVAAGLVAGVDAVADQHHRAAHVVGDHAEPDVVAVVGAVPAAGELLGPLDHREHDVDLVHVLHALQQERDPLQAHAGVDVLLRQGPDDVEVLLAPDRGELLLHEDEVPELEVAVLGTEVAVRAVRRPAVDQDLRARPARPGHAHRPVVLLLAQPDDPVVGQPGDLPPEVDRLGVLVVDAGVELVLGQPEPAVVDRAGHQLPRELDGAFLEVVAEREVAAHLEEGAVAGGLADVLDVRGAHALLHAHGAVVRRRLLAEEVRLERHHAGVDEQQVRVVQQHRRRRHGVVAVPLEVSDEPSADLRGVHQLLPSPSRSVPWATTARWRPASSSGVP